MCQMLYWLLSYMLTLRGLFALGSYMKKKKKSNFRDLAYYLNYKIVNTEVRIKSNATLH